MDSKRQLIVCAITLSLLFPLISDAQQLPSPPPQAAKSLPTPLAPQALPASSRSVAHLAFHVLEIKETKTLEALAIVEKYFPVTSSDAAIFTDEVTQDQLNSMVRELVDADVATVLSRPQMMTIAEQSAQIEVGQQLEGLPTKDAAVSKPRKVGLQMKCVPHLASAPNRMRLDIECTIAKADQERSLIVDGKSYPAINEKQLSTTIEATSGESVVLRGPANNMLITLTPTWAHPQLNTAVEQVGFMRESPRWQGKSSAKILDDISIVSETIESASGTTLLNISIKNDNLDVELALDEGTSVASLRKTLAELDQLKIDSLNLRRPGNGSIIKIECHIVKPVRKPNTRAEELTMLREDVNALRDEIRQLKETLQDHPK